MTQDLFNLLLKETSNKEVLASLAPLGFQPDNIYKNFSKHRTKIAWQCKQGHLWFTTLYKRESGSGCLICSGKQVLAGFNDLESNYPDVAKQWHNSKNNIASSQVTARSSKKAWWLCDKGHEWEAVINSRTKGGSGCPYCANQKVLAGFNDLESNYPDVAKQWHPTMNNNLLPSMVIAHSNKKHFWICDKGHTYTAPALYLLQGRSCGVCKNMQTEIGVNSLLDTNPELEHEYSTKNKLPFSSYRKNSKAKVIWSCDKGHEWEASIYKRTSLNRGCHECNGYKLSQGDNDFKSKAPEQLRKEFNADKNKIKIEELFISSRRKVWWICEKGHEWEAAVYSRTNGNGCRKCTKQTSQTEQEIADFLSNGYDIMQNTKSIIPPHELDIYIPEKNIAIEYNGIYWHSEEAGKDKHYHYNKWLACKEQGIQLIQIWEDDFNRNPELVKKMLAHKLGVSQQETVYARKTTVKLLAKKEVDEFLNKNHIQGTVDGKIRLALMSEGFPVAVMVLKTEAGSKGAVLNLLRYATSVNVIGGFTKLLSWVEKNIPNITSIVTFSDNTVSDGGLYENNGFVIANTVKPDYMYVVKSMRVHKFNYRLERFKKDPDLKWEEGLSETELAKLNNLPRIWDAGKVKWVKII